MSIRVWIPLAGLLVSQPAWADIESHKRDCVRGTGRVQVDGCSRFLGSERFGARGCRRLMGEDEARQIGVNFA